MALVKHMFIISLRRLGTLHTSNGFEIIELQYWFYINKINLKTEIALNKAYNSLFLICWLQSSSEEGLDSYKLRKREFEKHGTSIRLQCDIFYFKQ